MANTTAYSFKNVQATLDGQTVTGFFDSGEVLTLNRNADKGSMLIGADGSALFSVSTDAAAQVSLRLKHTSPTHRLLNEKLKRQQARGGAARGFPFDFVDTSSGEGGNGEQFFIMQAPSVSKGMEATVREWVLITGQWNDLIPTGGE